MIPELRTGLVVKGKFAGLIVEGKKIWEIRKIPPYVTGTVGVIDGDRDLLLGTVEITGFLGPFSLNELMKHQDKHHGGRFLIHYAKGNVPLYAWILRNPVKFSKPLKVKYREGKAGIAEILDVGLE